MPRRLLVTLTIAAALAVTAVPAGAAFDAEATDGA